MPDFTYVSVDPGLATGVAIYSPSSGVTTHTFDPDRFSVFLRRGAPDNSFWIVERFLVTARTARLSQQPEAAELIGAIKYEAFFRDWPVRLQNPTDRTSDKTLDMLYGLPAGLSDHEVSALGHLTAGMAAMIGMTEDWKVFTRWMGGPYGKD